MCVLPRRLLSWGMGLVIWAATWNILTGTDGIGSRANGSEPLPGTAPLEVEGDLSMEVVDRVDRWFLAETSRLQDALTRSPLQSPEDRQQKRDRLRRILGLNKDPRLTPRDL